MSESLRDKSRRNWANDSNSNENIQLGCLLRIADATELMAKRHADLVSERDWLSAAYKRNAETIVRLERSLSAKKGQITKLKKQLAAIKDRQGEGNV